MGRAPARGTIPVQALVTTLVVDLVEWNGAWASELPPATCHEPPTTGLGSFPKSGLW